MKLCKDCKNIGKKHNCQFYASTSNYAERCKNFEQRRLTNADRIHAMTNEDLAMIMMCPNENGLAEIECDKSDSCNCYQCLLQWLQSEVEDRNETD